MKIYTRTGDTGETSLFGGGRVSKDVLRIEAYGSVDELNAIIGVCRTVARGHPGATLVDRLLVEIQSDLFVLGAELATPPESRTKPPHIPPEKINELEHRIDELEASLPPLRNFILPAGGSLSAHLHFARTVARRAERAIVRASHEESIRTEIITYLNRLSDFLFVIARWSAHQTGEGDEVWKSPPV